MNDAKCATSYVQANFSGAPLFQHVMILFRILSPSGHPPTGPNLKTWSTWFETQFGPKLGEVGASWDQHWSKLVQVGPRLGLSWTKLGPSWVQVGPSWAQVGAKLDPSWNKMKPDASQIKNIKKPMIFIDFSMFFGCPGAKFCPSWSQGGAKLG